jgi:hypothetical protein
MTVRARYSRSAARAARRLEAQVQRTRLELRDLCMRDVYVALQVQVRDRRLASPAGKGSFSQFRPRRPDRLRLVLALGRNDGAG